MRQEDKSKIIKSVKMVISSPDAIYDNIPERDSNLGSRSDNLSSSRTDLVYLDDVCFEIRFSHQYGVCSNGITINGKLDPHTGYHYDDDFRSERKTKQQYYAENQYLHQGESKSFTIIVKFDSPNIRYNGSRSFKYITQVSIDEEDYNEIQSSIDEARHITFDDVNGYLKSNFREERLSKILN